MSKPKASASTPAAAELDTFFPSKIPVDPTYMHNILLTFVHAIPKECYAFCASPGYKEADFDPDASEAEQTARLRAYVAYRLGHLADFEYRSWINGTLPFVTPRELQLWRLQIFVQHLWFWSLPDDDDLAMIFNLTKRRANNLAADFIARFRKTIIYPVALRRLYYLVRNDDPQIEDEKHPKGAAVGGVYRVPSLRYLHTAQSLVEDIRAQLPKLRIANPYPWDKEQLLIWIDREMLDVIKTNAAVKDRLYDMYKVPTSS